MSLHVPGRPRAGRRSGVLAALVGAALVLLPLLGLPAAPAGADEHEALAVEVTLQSLTPAVLEPGEDLVLTGTVRNTGDTPVTEPRLVVHLDRNSFISRTSLDRWRTADPSDRVGAAIHQVDLPEAIPPGGTVPVEVTVPAGSIGLRTAWSSWGPRGLAVEVVDRADPARARLGLTRTFLLWYPVDEVTATRVTVLVPLVGPAADPAGTVWPAELEALTQPDGRLANVLTATAEADVTWAVDPWLVEVGSSPEAPTEGDGADEEGAGQDDADTSGTDTSGTDANGADGDDEDGPPAPTPSPTGSRSPSASPGADRPDEDAGAGDEEPADEGDGVSGATTPAGPFARAWTADLLDGLTGRDVTLLPYADADVAALAHAEADEVLDRAVRRSEELTATTGLPEGARVQLTWPAGPQADLETAAFGSTDVDRALVAAPGQLPVPGVLTYTPTGRTTARTAGGDVTVLVPDERLTAALTTGQTIGTEPEPTVTGTDEADGTGTARTTQRPTAVTARQDVLAELAVITRERPSDARHLLVTVPRDWSPRTTVAAAQLEALDAAPWAETEPLSALVGTPDPGVDRGTLPDTVVAESEIPATDLATLQRATAERADLADMLTDPAAVLGDADREILLPASVAWRSDPVGRAAVVAASVARTQALADGVVVPPSSTVNLISTSGELPVRVANTLDQEVTVEVALRPGDSRLRADEPRTVTIPPRSEQTVGLPVHAIQSADVGVTVEVRTPGGTLVDDSTVMTVRVRAEWEGIGAAIAGVLLALGLVIGIVRTVRRGRTGRRGAPQTEAGPDALSPEEAEEAEGSEDAGEPEQVTHER